MLAKPSRPHRHGQLSVRQLRAGGDARHRPAGHRAAAVWKRWLAAFAATAALAWGGAALAQADDPLPAPVSGLGTVVTPDSSVPQPGSSGKTAHTNVKVFVPKDVPSTGINPYNGNFYETPGSLACVYHLVPTTLGCVPHKAKIVAGGGSRTIAIVDAYDHPFIKRNLDTYSAQLGLPPADFRVAFAGGTRPPQDPSGGWEVEEALDVEMAHAMAPYAHIVLVEANSNSLVDLLAAVDVASYTVAQQGGGEVSMSFGSDEFSGQASLDSHFLKPGVVYFASSGDSPGVEWPSSSANVVSVGGTSLSRNASTGTFYGETTWDSGGGGPSSVIPSPPYQSGVRFLTGGTRATPDIAAVANPYTGVLVFDFIPGSSSATGWMVVGGTSVAAPLSAGLANASALFRGSSAEELSNLYGRAGGGSFRIVTKGICGPGASYSPTTPWSPCTGLGSPALPPPF